MKLILPAFFMLLTATLSAQTVQLVDKTTNEAVPFVKVIPTPGNPVLADIDGYFTIPAGAEQLAFISHDFHDTTIAVSLIGEKIQLRPLASELEEITIVPGVNPAERIIELAMANRKKNHPMSDEAFTYDSYSKFVVTMDPDMLKKIPAETTDSVLMDLRKFFNAQHLFMLESTAKKSFEPPYREKEVITAYKVSGFSDPAFSTFANELQTFNFYENQFNLLGKSYINPLAFGSLRRYLFILEDQTVANGDTTFTIRFQPRRDKNFNGLKGWLYINSHGYALEKVIAEPFEKSETVQPKIVQEYALIDGRRWFPVKLSTEAFFTGLKLTSTLQDGFLVGRGSTYIDHIVLSPDLSKQRFNAVTVETEANANEKDSTHWDATRKYGLTEQEKRTYVVIDSVSQAVGLEKKLTMLASIAAGKVPLGYVQLDLLGLLNYREYEGYRLGLGLETSKKLWKRGTVGGYFGYGTRDKDWKYGGYARYLLVPKQFVEIQASFRQDLIERGGVQLLSKEQALLSNDFYRNLYIANMERQRKAELAVSGYITPRMKVLISGNYQRINLTDNYVYTAPTGQSYDGGRAFDLAETSMEFTWTIREKLMYLGTRRVSLGSKWPKLTIKGTKGWPGIAASQFDYARLNVDLQQDIQVRGLGRLSYLLSAGQSFGEVPLFLNQVAPGTGGNWNVSVMNTFETMRPSTFYQKQQVAFFTRFTFKPMDFKVKWTSPQIVLHHAMGTGTFSRKEEHYVGENPFQSMDKGYYEAGLLVDKLLNINFLGLGVGAFYNYGPYAFAKAEKNVTLKLGISFRLD